ncbi:MAG: tetratricopeptide repeat protein [Desulfobacterales bacterium]|uniref:Tetratricopeptide repeat protein n=1 Tax=Candidatus Desulfatibia vada TaxID=2841696 RepID=A0A8J6NUA0_9BACT|nr:tetratricopeptide repeat protein [Candidatus Desulfatibia vada]
MIDLKEMTVLIVDDIITMCKSIHRMMKTIGYGDQFFYAHNGREALRILRKEPIDLVLMDYNMPEMQGGEALSVIRDDRILRDIPVIMITAQAYQDYVAEAAESYVDALILKPLTIKILGNKVVDVVAKANNPPPIVAHLKRARDFEEEGDLDAAIQEALLAMELDPDSSRAIRELGYFHLKKGALEEAEKWLLQAARMNHMDVIACHNLGELYLKQDKIDDAHHYFEKAMAISPRHLDRGISFGKTLVQRNMTPRAIKVFTQAFKFSRTPLVLQEEVADFCFENGAGEYAASLFKELISQLPQRTDLLFKLGKTWESLGDVKKALPYLIEAEKNDDANLEVKLHLAQDYISLGKPIWAETVLKRLLKIDPDHKEAQELLQSCVKM